MLQNFPYRLQFYLQVTLAYCTLVFLSLYKGKKSQKDFLVKVACRVRVAYLKESNHHFFTVFRNKFLKHVFDITLKLNTHN